MSRGKAFNGIATKEIERRRCIVCHRVCHKLELIRIVKTSAGDIFIDKLKRIQGHGYYICKDFKCLDVLKRRNNFEKILKSKPTKRIYEDINNIIEQ